MRSGDRETCLIAFVYLFTFKLYETTYSPAHRLVVVLNKLFPAGRSEIRFSSPVYSDRICGTISHLFSGKNGLFFRGMAAGEYI